MSLGKQEEGVAKVRALQLVLLGCPQNFYASFVKLL